MIQFDQVSFKSLALHRVGNKIREEGVLISPDLYSLADEQLRTLLMDYFLMPFKHDEYFRFTHDTDLRLNELFAYCSDIFASRSQFYDKSVAIAKHLYQHSSHPKVQSGELYVAYFADCQVEDELTDAIGIFKSENKDLYLKPSENTDGVALSCERGINIKKLDKGCLVFNTSAEDGFRVLIIDKTGKTPVEGQAQYWRDDFLRLERVQDNAFVTQNALQMCQDFCETTFLGETQTPEQIVFMSKAVNYFTQHENFDIDEFSQEIFDDAQQIEQFKEFKEEYQAQMGVDQKPEFRISKPTVKAMKRKFKSLIQLDTSIDIRLKSEITEQYIERGYDEARQMCFYKVYFREEL